jgi:hypothetical protein
MRSPFNPGGAGELLTNTDAAALWQLSINALEALGPVKGIDAAMAGLLRTLPPPTNSAIERLLFDTNTGLTTSLDGAVLPDLSPIDEAYTETFELGWNGLVADGRLSITADVYYTKKNAFVSPLVIETPLLFLDEADVVTYLTPFLGAPTATALGAGIALIPLGVVSSDQVGAQGADLIARRTAT